MQQSAGLDGRDVYSLGQSSDGTIVAGTGHGIYRLKDTSWIRVDEVDLNASQAPETKVAPKALRSRAGQKGRVASKGSA